MSSVHDFVEKQLEKRDLYLYAGDDGVSLELSDERMRELVADVMKDGPCAVPGCAVCSGEMARRSGE